MRMSWVCSYTEFVTYFMTQSYWVEHARLSGIHLSLTTLSYCYTWSSGMEVNSFRDLGSLWLLTKVFFWCERLGLYKLYSSKMLKTYDDVNDFRYIRFINDVYIFQGSLDVCSCNTVPLSSALKWFSVSPGTVGVPSTLTLHLTLSDGCEFIELFEWCYRWTDVVMLWLVVRWLFKGELT